MMDWTPLRDIPDPALVVMCGASGSGKSTLATFWDGQVVSSDQLRALIAAAGVPADDNRDTFDLVHRVSGHAAAPGAAHRGGRHQRGPRAPAPAAGLAADTEVSRRRGGLLAAAGDLPGPQRGPDAGQVPEDVVRRQYKRLTAEMPSKSEGFERVIVTGGESWLARHGGRELPLCCAPDGWGRTTTPGWRARRTAWPWPGRTGHVMACYAPACYGVRGYGRADEAP